MALVMVDDALFQKLVNSVLPSDVRQHGKPHLLPPPFGHQPELPQGQPTAVNSAFSREPVATVDGMFVWPDADSLTSDVSEDVSPPLASSLSCISGDSLLNASISGINSVVRAAIVAAAI